MRLRAASSRFDRGQRRSGFESLRAVGRDVSARHLHGASRAEEGQEALRGGNRSGTGARVTARLPPAILHRGAHATPRCRRPTTDRQGPLTTPPAQVERLELECDRDEKTDVVRWYEPRKES